MSTFPPPRRVFAETSRNLLQLHVKHPNLTDYHAEHSEDGVGIADGNLGEVGHDEDVRVLQGVVVHRPRMRRQGA